LARKAAAMGVELFCVDDGWFGSRRSDNAGLGDWVVRPDAFPNGLEPLVQEVHRLGMKFGLWVEPEMVNPDSDLYRQHPDWVLHFPGRERTESRNQLILDFGRGEVVDYILAHLDDLVSRYSIAFFKWDMNRLATEPGSAGKAIWRKHGGRILHYDRLRLSIRPGYSELFRRRRRVTRHLGRTDQCGSATTPCL
jgi:alpha-galactosidase